MFKQSVGAVFAIFSIQLLLVNGAIFSDKSYYEALIQNSNIEQFKLELLDINVPNFRIIDGIDTRVINNETIVKCLVEHSPQLSQIITDGQDGSKACLKAGGEKLEKIGQTIAAATIKIFELWDEVKNIIPSCAKENTDASTTLQCMIVKEKNIEKSLQEAGRTIQKAVESARGVMEETKKCLFALAQVLGGKLEALGLSIQKCIEAGL